MNQSYPRTATEIPIWARGNGVGLNNARQRFVQYVLLSAIAMEPSLRAACVFKGGNALDFFMLPNRSTLDLDFSFDMQTNHELGSSLLLKPHLDRAVQRAHSRFNLGLRVQTVRNQPPGEDRHFATIRATVGYALPDQAPLAAKLARGLNSPQVIPIEISLNEPVTEAELVRLNPGLPALRIASLNDIVAEKLRALLQQPIRDRHRRQDVLDLAVILGGGHPLMRDVVSRALLEKAAARDVPVSVAAFHQPEIASRSRHEYEGLEASARFAFILFDEAFAKVLAFVETLDIPRE